MTSALLRLPVTHDVAWEAFTVAFPKRKRTASVRSEDVWEEHRQRISEFRDWSGVPLLPECTRRGMLAGLAQWSVSFAGLVARN